MDSEADIDYERVDDGHPHRACRCPPSAVRPGVFNEGWRLFTNLAPKKEGPALYAELQDEAWTAVEDIALRAEDAGADGRFVSRLGLLMACLRHLSEEQEILRQGDGRPPSPQTVGANSGLPPPF